MSDTPRTDHRDASEAALDAPGPDGAEAANTADATPPGGSSGEERMPVAPASVPAAPEVSLAPASPDVDVTAGSTRLPGAPASVPASPGLRLESASSDVDVTADSSRLPGQHRGGFSRLPTAPVAVAVPSAPSEDAQAQWAPTSQAGPQRGLAAWALGFSVLGLIASMFVGWGFPVGLVAVVSGILALRRPTESRAVAGWAVVLGTASLIYSAGWLWFAATQTNLLG